MRDDSGSSRRALVIFAAARVVVRVSFFFAGFAFAFAFAFVFVWAFVFAFAFGSGAAFLVARFFGASFCFLALFGAALDALFLAPAFAFFEPLLDEDELFFFLEAGLSDGARAAMGQT